MRIKCCIKCGELKDCPYDGFTHYPPTPMISVLCDTPDGPQVFREEMSLPLPKGGMRFPLCRDCAIEGTELTFHPEKARMRKTRWNDPLGYKRTTCSLLHSGFDTPYVELPTCMCCGKQMEDNFWIQPVYARSETWAPRRRVKGEYLIYCSPECMLSFVPNDSYVPRNSIKVIFPGHGTYEETLQIIPEWMLNGK